MEKFEFYLYITGKNKISENAIENLTRFCEEEIQSNFEIFITDLLLEPYFAEELKIFATPTLIKKSPGKVIRVIGDLSNKNQLMEALELEKTYG